MKKIIFLFCLTAFAQTPAALRYTRFGQNIISLSVGAYSSSAERCTFWLNSPSAGQVQIACYASGVSIPFHNSVETLMPIGFIDNRVFPDQITISWEFKPGEYHLTASNPDGTNKAAGDGTF